MTQTAQSIQFSKDLDISQDEILTPAALDFLEFLHAKFDQRRQALLANRQDRLAKLKAGEMPKLLPETENIRKISWQVAPIPADLQDRKIEITGPVDKKMLINGLNSGARVFMADFEDATSPTWQNLTEGQANLKAANLRKLEFEAENGKKYTLNETVAVLKVRPRGWHLDEKHLLINGKAISGSLFDFGLYFFHNAEILMKRGSAPYFYLPKLENHLEARLWNDVFVAAQDYLNIPQSTIKVTVLIETILAAFEMEEILFELKQHIAGLNAGRWDYIFSAIKKFSHDPSRIFPDRSEVTMTVPFMEVYAKEIVRVCHKRGAHAIGGMAAFIPSRRDAQINEKAFAKVRADKEREANLGFDGSWVAHPDLVSIGLEAFLKAMENTPHQKQKTQETAQFDKLIDFEVKTAKITEQGIRTNIRAGILYIESWLRGIGAAGIDNLMEDAATAEISRAQLWQWLKFGLQTAEGKVIDEAYYETLKGEELARAEKEFGSFYAQSRIKEAIEIFDDLVKNPVFAEFLTLKAYQYID